MPRGARKIYANAIVGVTSRGNNKRILFKKSKDYKFLKGLLLKYRLKYKFILYHYCLMRNHIHLLLKITDEKSISKIMQGIQLSYFNYYRKRYGYVGRFWQGRFYSKLVEDEKYFLTSSLYIEGNPVKAGLVKDPTEYKWSSYNKYAFGKNDLLVDFDDYYIALSNNKNTRRIIYRELIKNYLEMENGSL